ncbi:hypothetical protein [Glacieibacterium sp.]|uniref:hypothetical protein n=1 Tax=Glacieibacterium sp. TaxID=2860237 RepID=UPI003AFFC37B
MTLISGIALPMASDLVLALPITGAAFDSQLLAATLALPMPLDLPLQIAPGAKADILQIEPPQYALPNTSTNALSSVAAVAPAANSRPEQILAPSLAGKASPAENKPWNGKQLNDETVLVEMPIGAAVMVSVPMHPRLTVEVSASPSALSVSSLASINAPVTPMTVIAAAPSAAQNSPVIVGPSLRTAQATQTFPAARPAPTITLDPAASTIVAPVSETTPSPPPRVPPSEISIIAGAPKAADSANPPPLLVAPILPTFAPLLATAPSPKAPGVQINPPAVLSRRRDAGASPSQLVGQNLGFAPSPTGMPEQSGAVLANLRQSQAFQADNSAPVDATVRTPAANVIELATDRLGAIRLALDTSDTALHVHVTADRSATAGLIVAQADRLQIAVETGGARLGALSVDVRDGGDPRRSLPWQPPENGHPSSQRRSASSSDTTIPARTDRFA